MKTLRQYIREAQEKKTAIGHFNISDSVGLWAVFNAARKMNLPVIIGVSEGERDFIGVRQAAALVKSLREQYDFPIFINADHTYSFERVKEAIDAGFDMVIFDGTELAFDANVRVTKQCVDYAKSSKPFWGERVLVEAELGYIGKSSKVLDSVPEGINLSDEYLTTAEQAKRFVQETRVDMLAPAVGNIHGMLAKGKDPALNISRVADIAQATGVPLVLHGASGNTDADIQNAIKAGVAIVHVNTELRVAYRTTLDSTLLADPKQVAPYKYLAPSRDAVAQVVEEKMKAFSFLG
ncbi:ketose-bisphosphate aldolase [Patescibacteria group bacterium]|nr:MAG: ketose-bisphosphate aldolase [Patescibacteria group bacterium]